MANTAKQHIFFLDDELDVCEAASGALEECGFEVSHFTHVADCLEQLRSQECDLLITDLKMPELDGIEVLREARHIAPWVPLLIVSGYGDVPTVVTAIKGGAVDFIEKPLGRENFLSKVESILAQSTVADSLGKPLTKKEMAVLRLIADGKSNKEIAHLFHRSLRTIELHRHHLMVKLGVDNIVDLLERAAQMGLVELPSKQGRDEETQNVEIES